MTVMYSAGPGESFTCEQCTAAPQRAVPCSVCMACPRRPFGVPRADARLAADGYLRAGDWTVTGGTWYCAARRIEIPDGIAIRDDDSWSGRGRLLTAAEAIEMLSRMHPGLTVTWDGTGSDPDPGFSVTVSRFACRLAHVQAIDGRPHLPEAARFRIACHALAASLAEAANMIAYVDNYSRDLRTGERRRWTENP